MRIARVVRHHETEVSRASVRLSQLLDWNAHRETLCEVAFIELLEEQWVGVSNVLAAPHGATHMEGVLVGVTERTTRKWRKRCPCMGFQCRKLGSVFQ